MTVWDFCSLSKLWSWGNCVGKCSWSEETHAATMWGLNSLSATYFQMVQLKGDKRGRERRKGRREEEGRKGGREEEERSGEMNERRIKVKRNRKHDMKQIWQNCKASLIKISGSQWGILLLHVTWQCLVTFFIIMACVGGIIYSVGRGQGCCQTPYNVQGSSHNRGSYPALINSAKGDRLWSRKGCPTVPCILKVFECLNFLIVETYSGTHL